MKVIHDGEKEEINARKYDTQKIEKTPVLPYPFKTRNSASLLLAWNRFRWRGCQCTEETEPPINPDLQLPPTSLTSSHQRTQTTQPGTHQTSSPSPSPYSSCSPQSPSQSLPLQLPQSRQLPRSSCCLPSPIATQRDNFLNASVDLKDSFIIFLEVHQELFLM